jgi:hypothetical protein
MQLACFASLALLALTALAEDTPVEPKAEPPSPAVQEASRIGVALGAAQRCGMTADDADAMMKLGFARLQMLSKDKELYAKSAGVMLEAQRYGSTDMPLPPGGCPTILPVASGIYGNLTYIIARADLDVPDLHRGSALQNFAVWSGQLAVMASHCGAQDEVVNKGIDLARQYIAKQGTEERERTKAESELSEVMLQAELENWGDKEKCTEILTRFGGFFGNLDSRLQN